MVLIAQIVVGVLVTAYMMFYLGVMSTDAPTSNYRDVLMGVSIALGLVGLPTIVLPGLALRELGRYLELKKLPFVYANAIIGLIMGTLGNPIFLLFSIVEFYFIYKIKQVELG